MSLWTFVAAGTVAESASGDLTLNEPAGVQAGDLLVACISQRATAAFTPPASWANAAAITTGANDTTVAPVGAGRQDYIVRTGSAPSYVWTRTGGGTAIGRVVAYRLSSGTPVFDQGSANTLASASTTQSTAGITTVEDGELLVMGECTPNDAASSNARATDPVQASWTERTDNVTATGNDVAVAISDAVKVIKGATGTFNWTAASSIRGTTVLGAYRARYNLVPEHGSFTLTGQSVVEPGVNRSRTFGPALSVDDGDTQNFTIADVAFGAEAVDRFIVCWFMMQLPETSPGVFVTVDSLTIGGVAATPLIYDFTVDVNDVNLGLVALRALVPTGATGDITIEYSNAGMGEEHVVLHHVYRVTGAGSAPTIVDAATLLDETGDGTVAVSIDYSRFGVTFAATYGDAFAGNVTTVWTGVTEDYDAAFGGLVVSSAASAWSGVNAAGQTVQANDDGAGTGFILSKLVSAFTLAPAGTGATLVADNATFALTGQAAGSLRTYIMPAAQATFTLTGQTAELNRGFFGASDHGVYTYTGQDVQFVVPRLFPDPGMFTYTGQDVDLIQGAIFSVDFGFFTLFAQDATLTYRAHGTWLEEASDADTWTEQAELGLTWTPQAALLNIWTEET